MSTATSHCESLACALATLCRRMAGAMCLISGLVLTLSFWLMFIGIPLALFGVALMVADRA